ncbi:hypothetical protein NSQ43_03170 [Sporosarcina sp. FSL W8-0480]|uniref:hypothetical protein n=1 Tax=Sporosarcina sp. FSL W8-0480 TaxID=2954701 RepID=UPI0030DC3092
MKNTTVSWSLVAILGITSLLLWAYSSELKNKVIHLDFYNNLTYLSGTSKEIVRYEQILAYEKSYITDEQVDIERFKKINVDSLESGALFPMDFNDDDVTGMNSLTNEMNLSILLFKKASTTEEREKHVKELESSLHKYKERFYQLAEKMGYCSDDNNSFCP